MKTPRDFWTDLRSSFWFVPAVIVCAAAMLALALIETDRTLAQNVGDSWPRLFGAGASGSRGVLSTIAGSMITVAGVIFSITIVSLSLASSQYTSRVIRNFIGDRANQTVLGIFVGIFAYCLVVLRTIRGGDEGAFVPGVSVLVAVVLAFVGIAFLIFFIQHIGSSIQAAQIIASVAKDTLKAVDHLFPESGGEPAGEPEGAASLTQQQFRGAIPARRTGYVQRVDVVALMAFARARQTTVRMECRIGEFVIEDTPLASVSEARDADPDAVRQINAAYTVDRQRTVDQDAAYGIRQLVDVALKGLSPGINDTTTAVMCVDYLTAILARLAHRQLETPGRGEAGEVQVIVHGPTYGDFVTEAFDQIRQNADGNVEVLRRLIHSLETLSRITPSTERRRVLLLQVEAVREMIQRSVQSPRERGELESHATRVSESLKGSS
jgi:uncharacterized membrane protein